MSESPGRPVRALHPYLLAIYPTLALYGLNPAETSPVAIVRPLLAALTLVCGLLLGLRLLVSNEPLRAFLASILVVALSFWGVCRPTLVILLGPEQHFLTIVLYLLPFLVGGMALRHVREWDALTRMGNILAGFLVAMGLISGLATGSIQSSIRLMTGGWETPPVLPDGGTLPRSRPDVYLIVLDGYGRHDVLKDLYGHDNEPFLAAMEERGFVVARHSRSNYSQTLLSLASCLNMQYLQQLGKLSGADSTDRLEPMLMIRQSAVFDVFRRFGYEIVATRTGYGSTEMTGYADRFLGNPGALSEFENVLVSLSLVPDLLRGFGSYPQFDLHRHGLSRSIEQLTELAREESARPKFVFAHLLAPHPPFVWDASGGEIQIPHRFNLFDGSFFEGTQETYRRAYVAQLAHLNTLVFQAVTRVLESSGRPPIIILLSDHGPGSSLDWHDPRKVDFEERFPNLMLLHAPGLSEDALDAAITPVNLFRLLLRDSFGQDIGRIEDRSYHSSWNSPYEFIPVHVK